MTIVPNSPDFFIILGFTIVIVVSQFLVVLYMCQRIFKNRKNSEKISQDFVLGVLVLIAALLIARLFYMYFDFILTKFTFSLYTINGNYWYWKVADLFATAGQIYIVYIIDKKILQFKLKGIVEWIMFASVVVVMVYPINNMNDFNTDSTLLVIPSIGLLVLPFVFIWLGHKSSGELKVTSYIIVWGAALYLVGSHCKCGFYYIH